MQFLFPEGNRMESIDGNISDDDGDDGDNGAGGA